MYNSEITNFIIKNKDIKDRKKLGQYFTNNHIKDKLFEALPIKENVSILEPSAGTGEFLININDNFSKKDIYGVELDEELFDLLNSKFKDIKLFNEDFLLKDFNQKFDYIIGNPPYFEFKPSNKIKEKFSDIIYGRTNIYSLFISKSIDLLKEKGYIAFVIPKTINTGKYFKKIREKIFNTIEIKNIIYLNKNEFEGAYQDVQVFIGQKVKNPLNVNFKLKIGKSELIVDNKIKSIFKDFSTIKELGFEVKTGRIVWNQEKEKLSNKHGAKLIWSNNIKDYNVVLKNQKEPKGQYIETNKKLIKKGIVVKRIVSKNNPKINCAICENFIAENHINVIIPKNPKVTIEELFEKLKNVKTNEAIKYITKSNQLSKNELENLIPIYKK